MGFRLSYALNVLHLVAHTGFTYIIKCKNEKVHEISNIFHVIHIILYISKQAFVFSWLTETMS